MGDDGIRTKVRYYLSTQCLKTGITEIFHLCSDLAQMGEIDKKHSHFQKSQRQRFILSRHSSYIAVTVNGGSGGENQLPSATSAIRDATLGQVKLRRGTGRVSMAMFWTEIHARQSHSQNAASTSPRRSDFLCNSAPLVFCS